MTLVPTVPYLSISPHDLTGKGRGLGVSSMCCEVTGEKGLQMSTYTPLERYPKDSLT